MLHSYQVTQETSGDKLYSEIKTMIEFPNLCVFNFQISAIEFSFFVFSFATN